MIFPGSLDIAEVKLLLRERLKALSTAKKSTAPEATEDAEAEAAARRSEEAGKAMKNRGKTHRITMELPWISYIWVCLKIGYIPNYSHLIGIMISKTIGFRGALFSDTPIYHIIT